MADNNIRFKISSHFNGEGFKQAEKALDANKKELNSVKDGLGKVSNAFADISPNANMAVTGIRSFVDAFLKGGIVGGGISLAM